MNERRPDHDLNQLDANLHWIKSSFSFCNSNCVEVASLPDRQVGVRDSKNPDGGVLRFTADEWRTFVGGVRTGKFDSFSNLCALEIECRTLCSSLSVNREPGERPPLYLSPGFHTLCRQNLPARIPSANAAAIA